MSHFKKIIVSIFLSLALILVSLPYQTLSAKASDSLTFVILSSYHTTVSIGDEFYIIALTSNGKQPTFKSSDSKIASVGTYGKVIAKKFGTVTITAKIKNAEASCRVTVKKTRLAISKEKSSIERGETLKLTATTSNNSRVTWKSSKKSVAIVTVTGTVIGLKPSETMITATANGTSKSFNITVKSPVVNLSKKKIKLFRTQSVNLSATTSSCISPTWKTNKKTVAIVDQSGTITALKHGTAVITATLDGVSKSCEVVVIQPTVTLNTEELCLKKGQTASLTATVSSGNQPDWSSSNPNIAVVDSIGNITACGKGKAYIYATEDGIKARCSIHITE